MFEDWTDREKGLAGIIAAAVVIGIYEYWQGKRRADAGLAGVENTSRFLGLNTAMLVNSRYI